MAAVVAVAMALVFSVVVVPVLVLNTLLVMETVVTVMVSTRRRW